MISWLLVGQGPRLGPEPLGNVPAEATAMVWANVPAVMASAPWERLVTREGGDQSMRRIERLCGFNPLARLSGLTLFAVGDAPGDLRRVGLLARGALDRSAFAECVREVVEEDGGSVRRVDIDGVPAVAGRGGSRAAFVGSDGIVGGDEETVRQVLRVARGERPGADGDETLRLLWQRVAPGSQMVAVAHVPEGWREAIRRWVRDSLDRELSPLSGLRAAGAGARLGRGLGLGIALEMDRESQAGALVDALRAQVEEALDRPVVALSAAGPALRRLQMEPQERTVVLTLELSSSQLEGAMDLIEELFREGDRADPVPRGRPVPRDGRGPRDGDAPRAAPADPAPDEIIRADGP